MRLLAVVTLAVALLAGPPALAQTVDTLGKIRTAKEIRVAFSGDSLPFSFVGERNQPAGYSIDLCNRVVAAIGRVVGEPNLKVTWLVGTVAERLSMIASGKADLDCANTSATLARRKDVDFSALVFVDGGGLMIKAGAATQRLADLNGRKIAVIAGTTTESRLRATLARRLINAEVVTIREGGEGVAMLESGAVDAFASDKIKLVGLAAQAKDPAAFALLAEDLSFEPYAFALPRNDSAFRLEVDRALTQVYGSGEIESIFGRWLGKLGRPSGLLAAMYVLGTVPE